MDIFAFLFMSSVSLVFLSDFLYATDSITQSQSLRDDMTLVSKNGRFELGFFNPGSSKNRYLGIWFNNIPIQTVVWVANRLNPINDSSRHVDGMKLGWDSRIGLEWRLSAWKSPDDPSPGELNYGIEHNNYPEAAIKNGTEKYFKTGPWNGLGYNGVPTLKANPVYNYSFVSTVHMGQSHKKWREFGSVPKDSCDTYNLCGVYGNCIIGETPICQCLEGFKPKSPDTWNPDEWSKGCVRITQLSCHDKDKIGFDKFGRLKLPDAKHTWVNGSMNLEECKVKCLNDCNCTAYSNSDIRNGGSGCAIWYGDLIDIRQISANGHDANGQDVYI
uniref:non-specific serine/threonine protein kinase n=1 Tax=Fagus sylvatica TaxID=28930 RepID=A0A2N9HCP4_FAGSY